MLCDASIKRDAWRNSRKTTKFDFFESEIKLLKACGPNLILEVRESYCSTTPWHPLQKLTTLTSSAAFDTHHECDRQTELSVFVTLACETFWGRKETKNTAKTGETLKIERRRINHRSCHCTPQARGARPSLNNSTARSRLSRNSVAREAAPSERNTIPSGIWDRTPNIYHRSTDARARALLEPRSHSRCTQRGWSGEGRTETATSGSPILRPGALSFDIVSRCRPTDGRHVRLLVSQARNRPVSPAVTLWSILSLPSVLPVPTNATAAVGT